MKQAIFERKLDETLAKKLFESDPELGDPENARLPSALESFWEAGAGDIS